jgi:hypothetical protein
MGDGSSTVQADEVPEIVFETLVNEYGESQQQKYTGYAVSQSLTELMHYLDPQQIVDLKAEANPTSKDESFKGMMPPGAAKYCINVKECLTTRIKLNYDYSKYGEFPWNDIQEFLDMKTTPVDDLAIRSMTVRLKSKKLRNRIREVLADMGVTDTRYVKSPFFFTVESRNVRENERDQVKKHNDEEFLNRVGHRVLELKSMYSLRAQQGKKDVLFRTNDGKMYPREFEDLAFNYNDATVQSYGALYSGLIINKWRAAFSRNLGEKTRMMWTEEEGQWMTAAQLDDDLAEEVRP